MFRVKTSQADTVTSVKRLVFLIDELRCGTTRRFLLTESHKQMESRLILFILVFAAICVGCTRPTANIDPSVEQNTANSTSPKATRLVTDDLGRTITVPVKITRAVSLAPSVTENIFAVGAGNRLVGVTTFCNYPDETKSIAKIGDTMNPNMELIIALKPDVVFVSTASQIEAFTKTLEASGIAVYVTNPTGLTDLYESLRQLGIIFDKYEAANNLAYALQHRQSEVCKITDGCLDRDKDGPAPDAIHVFVQISKEPLFTVGKSSFLTQLVRDAGGLLVTENVETAFPKLSKETASALKPEAIILSESDDNNEPNEVFKNSPAVKNKRVYKVSADLLSRPGPRLVDALEQIAKDLHPEKFK
jgi:iron complex transport system substrate-binding protein